MRSRPRCTGADAAHNSLRARPCSDASTVLRRLSGLTARHRRECRLRLDCSRDTCGAGGTEQAAQQRRVQQQQEAGI